MTLKVPQAELVDGNSRRAGSVWRRWFAKLLGPPWKISSEGDLLVDSVNGETPGIGGYDNSPAFYAVGEATTLGVEGFTAYRQATGAGGGACVGWRNEQLPSGGVLPEANAPWEIRGNAVMLTAETVLLETPNPITEDYYLIATPSIQGADGKHYAPLALGPRVVYSQRDTATDTRDLDVTDTSVQVVSLTLANSYPNAEDINFTYGVQLQENGGRTVIFTVDFYLNAAPPSAPTFSIEASMSGNSQYLTQTYADLADPLTAGDVITMWVTGVGTQQLSDGWVMGSIQPSLLEVKQG